MKLIHLTKRYRAAPLDTGINLALNPFFNESWVEELKPYNMIGTPGEPSTRKEISMVLLQHTSRNLARVNSSRPNSSVITSEKFADFACTTNDFTHSGHFWSTTYKPYASRPKEFYF